MFEAMQLREIERGRAQQIVNIRNRRHFPERFENPDSVLRKALSLAFAGPGELRAYFKQQDSASQSEPRIFVICKEIASTKLFGNVIMMVRLVCARDASRAC